MMRRHVNHARAPDWFNSETDINPCGRYAASWTTTRHFPIMMKSTSALKKKGTAGADVFRRKDKDRDATKFSFKSGSSSSSPSSSSRIGSPKASAAAAASTTATRKPKPAHHPKQTNMPLSNSPITLDLHRFADSNMNPEECMFYATE